MEKCDEAHKQKTTTEFLVNIGRPVPVPDFESYVKYFLQNANDNLFEFRAEYMFALPPFVQPTYKVGFAIL